jgi:XTP/dITP diphosphohydrolase
MTRTEKRELVFITTNTGKRSSVSQMARDFGITITEPLTPIELVELQHDSVKVIARHKARSAVHHIHDPFMVHDGGCFCCALNGFPGTNTRQELEKIGLKGILRLLEGEDRRAVMQNAVAYYSHAMWLRGRAPEVFYDEVPGTMLFVPQGIVDVTHPWSTLFQVFVPDGLTEPFAGLGLGEMQAWRESRGEPSSYTQLFQWLTQVYWSTA